MFKSKVIIPFVIGLAVGSLGLYLAKKVNSSIGNGNLDDNGSGNSNNNNDNININNSMDESENNSNNSQDNSNVNNNNSNDNSNNENRSEDDNSNNKIEDNSNNNDSDSNSDDDNDDNNSNQDGLQLKEEAPTTTTKAIQLYNHQERFIREEKKVSNSVLLSSSVDCYILEDTCNKGVPGFYKPAHVFIYHGEGMKLGRLESLDLVINIYPYYWCSIEYLKKEIIKMGDEHFGTNFIILIEYPTESLAPLGLAENHSLWSRPTFANDVVNPLVVEPELPRKTPKKGSKESNSGSSSGSSAFN